MAVGVEGGVPPLPNSILLSDWGVEVRVAVGGSVRTAGAAVTSRPAMRDECLGVKITTSLATRLLLVGVGIIASIHGAKISE
jgi:hypothetical protein